MAKRLKTLLRHGELHREEDLAIEFWRSKDYLRNEFEYSQHWLDEMWKSKMAGAEATRTDTGIVLINSLPQRSSRSFRTQSHWSFITGQRINSEQFLGVHLSHRMCNQFRFHREFRIDTRRTKLEQKTDDILHVCGSNEQRTQRSE